MRQDFAQESKVFLFLINIGVGEICQDQRLIFLQDNDHLVPSYRITKHMYESYIYYRKSYRKFEASLGVCALLK